MAHELLLIKYLHGPPSENVPSIPLAFTGYGKYSKNTAGKQCHIFT